MSMVEIDIETLDALFDSGEVDIDPYLDPHSASRPGLEHLRDLAAAPVPTDEAGQPIRKLTRPSLTDLATKVQQDPRSSKLQRDLAATALTQLGGPRPLCFEELDPAVRVLGVDDRAASARYAEATRSLAAWVMEHATWDHWDRTAATEERSEMA